MHPRLDSGSHFVNQAGLKFPGNTHGLRVAAPPEHRKLLEDLMAMNVADLDRERW
jgi:hypothetical protein